MCSITRTRAAVSCRSWAWDGGFRGEPELHLGLGDPGCLSGDPGCLSGEMEVHGCGKESCLIWSVCRTSNAIEMAVSLCWECEGGSDPQEAAGILLETGLGRVCIP